MSEVAVTRPWKGRKSSRSEVIEMGKGADMPAWKKAFWAGEKQFGQDLSKKGWSGRTWQGREFGPPEIAQGGKVNKWIQPCKTVSSRCDSGNFYIAYNVLKN